MVNHRVAALLKIYMFREWNSNWGRIYQTDAYCLTTSALYVSMAKEFVTKVKIILCSYNFTQTFFHLKTYFCCSIIFFIKYVLYDFSDPVKQCDIDLTSDFSIMDDGVNIIRMTDFSPLHENGLIIISHPVLLKQLGVVNKIAVDATFSSSPKLFSQVWIIYGK